MQQATNAMLATCVENHYIHVEWNVKSSKDFFAESGC
jgi:hypothetical protein